MYKSFEKKFETEEDCIRFLADQRWPNGKFTCPACAQPGELKLQKRGLIQCSSCRRQTSVTAGTIFHGAKTTLLKLFRIIWNIAHGNDQSARSASTELQLSYETCWRWIKKAQSIVSNFLNRTDQVRKEIHWSQFKSVVFRRSSEIETELVTEQASRQDELDTHTRKDNLVSGFTGFISETFHGVSRKYLQRYADQFSLRRRVGDQQFKSLIRDNLLTGPISLDMILEYSSPDMIVLL